MTNYATTNRVTKKKEELQAAEDAAPGPRMLELRANAKLNTIWRFYRDVRGRWRWQRISVQREVIAESPTGYRTYEECLADAQASGYVFHPSHARVLTGQRSR